MRNPPVGRLERGAGKESQVLADAHVAQLILHADTGDVKGAMFRHWVLFDNLWLAANRALGESLLRYAGRWDVLMDKEAADETG